MLSPSTGGGGGGDEPSGDDPSKYYSPYPIPPHSPAPFEPPAAGRVPLTVRAFDGSRGTLQLPGGAVRHAVMPSVTVV